MTHSYPLACGWIARERATIEARFFAGRARLAFSPPGSWPRSPQLPLHLAAIMRHHAEDEGR